MPKKKSNCIALQVDNEPPLRVEWIAPVKSHHFFRTYGSHSPVVNAFPAAII